MSKSIRLGFAPYRQADKHKSGHNMNIRAAIIHLLGDIIQSFGVVVASVIIYFRHDW